jgi:hypothetical protein
MTHKKNQIAVLPLSMGSVVKAFRHLGGNLSMHRPETHPLTAWFFAAATIFSTHFPLYVVGYYSYISLLEVAFALVRALLFFIPGFSSHLLLFIPVLLGVLFLSRDWYLLSGFVFEFLFFLSGVLVVFLGSFLFVEAFKEVRQMDLLEAEFDATDCLLSNRDRFEIFKTTFWGRKLSRDALFYLGQFLELEAKIPLEMLHPSYGYLQAELVVAPKAVNLILKEQKVILNVGEAVRVESFQRNWSKWPFWSIPQLQLQIRYATVPQQYVIRTDSDYFTR